MASLILINIDSGNAFLPGCTKLLFESVLKKNHMHWHASEDIFSGIYSGTQLLQYIWKLQIYYHIYIYICIYLRNAKELCYELILAYSHHMVAEIWVNICSGNGLLPDSNKQLPEPILTGH